MIFSKQISDGSQTAVDSIGRIKILRGGPDWHQIGGDYQTRELFHANYNIFMSLKNSVFIQFLLPSLYLFFFVA